jgi:hypothetical protein
MSKPSAAVAYQLAFECSPIILTGGVAQFLGGMLPIIAITESLNFFDGLLGGSADTGLENFFAHFEPAPGASLLVNEYGRYPFANQSVAANAVIGQPLKVSMKMTAKINGMFGRLAIMSALQKTIELHSNLGGTYTVVTPSYIYTNCLLNNLVCVSDVGSKSQVIWQWDFEQPLLTEQCAAVAYNGMMGNIANAVPSTGALSGTEVIGSPLSLATSSLIPSVGGSSIGTSVAGYTPF